MTQLISNAWNWASEKLSDTESYIAEQWLKGWTPSQIPDLTGKVALVTGANSGMGWQLSRKLAENGAKVYMVSRDLKNGQEAAARIRQQIKRADLEVIECDMSLMSNVVDLVRSFKRSGDPLHVLVNNAGVFHPGPFAKTKDGLEQTLAVNYYAHALLTLGLMDRLRATPGSRAVFMASPAEAFGKLDWSNLKGDKYKDSGMVPYGTSKLYMMMLARELSTRVPEVDFLCVHPGVVMTPLQHKASLAYWTAWLVRTQVHLMGQTDYRGAFSALYAATEPSLTGKHFTYIGPNNLNLYPTTERQPSNKPVHNPVACWRLTEDTARILAELVGPANMPAVPRHPDDTWGRDKALHQHRAEAAAGNKVATHIAAPTPGGVKQSQQISI